MIFIGIFGIKEVQKSIGTCNNVICPACHALTRLEVFKGYTCFHIFFIPIFRWNTKYYVKPACCGSIYEFDPISAQQYEKGQITEIRNEYLHPVNHCLPFGYCANCGANVESGFNFCPYCGRKL